MIDLRLLGVEEVARVDPARQAADLRRGCGHAIGEPRLLREGGFRFYPMSGGELPHFLNRRFTVDETRSGALTLLAGLDPASGDAVLEGCRTSDEASRELAAGPGGIWLVRVTLGNATISWQEISGLLVRRDPVAFAAIAGELLSLTLCRRSACPLCRRS